MELRDYLIMELIEAYNLKYSPKKSSGHYDIYYNRRTKVFLVKHLLSLLFEVYQIKDGKRKYLIRYEDRRHRFIKGV